ncbi:MAG: hypothetical protein V1709_05905 [Planctomycetota bacterium]
MFNKKFEVKLYVPENAEVTGDMPDRWANGLKNAAETMNDRRQAKIPDDETFIHRLAGPSTEGYAPYVPTGFISKSDRSAEAIRGTHSTNITTAFNRWNDKINKAFATSPDGVVAKEFKEKVDASKDIWAIRVGEGVLRLTGNKIRGRGVAPIAAFYLVGDKRAGDWIHADDYADGMPYDIAKIYQRVALKAAVQQRIIQGGMMIINQQLQPSAVTAENSTNTDLLNGLRDPAKCDVFVTTPANDKCFCVWAIDSETNRLYLWIQIGLTTP